MTSGFNCILCGSSSFQCIVDNVSDFEYGAPGVFQWNQCQSCRIIGLTPQPTPELLAIAYPADYHAYQQPSSKITQKLIGWSREKYAQHLQKLVPPGGAVLDIGCSRGDLLAAIGQKGNFKLYGVEYHPEIAQQARAKGIQVWTGDFEQADIPPGSMDLILMQHVLEHVFHPTVTLQKAFSLLKPGGRILGELPNFNSWDAALFGRYWGGGHAPRHIWHFTPQSLNKLLEQTGFEQIQLKPALHTGHWALSLQTFLRRGRTDLQGLSSGRTWYYPFLLLLTLPVNLIQFMLFRTGVMRFEGRKPLR